MPFLYSRNSAGKKERISIVNFQSPKNTTTYMHYYLKKSNLLTHYRNVQNQTIIGILEYHTLTMNSANYTLSNRTTRTLSKYLKTNLSRDGLNLQRGATVKNFNICYRLLK